ncbi:MAG: CHASE2 domain-containing protein, partial [bacterium]|nr:CHASE2 domain-containing protein [bacterium]
MRNNRLQRLSVGIVLGLSIAIIVIVLSEIIFPGIFENFEAKTFDLRFQTKIKLLEETRQGEKIDDIVIVDIDNRSLNQFGRYQQWPRDYYTEIINYLTESGALIIGFDILFMEPDIDRMADTLLVRATRKSGNVCHSFSFSSAEPDAFLYKMEAPPAPLDTLGFSYLASEEIINAFPGQDRFDGKFFELYKAAKKIGFANFQPDNDSVIRKIPLFMNFAGELYPSLAMAMALFLYNVQNSEVHIQPGEYIRLDVHTENGVKPLYIPIDQQGQMLINYMGSYQTFRYISFYDVWARRVPPEFFAGKIVLVGASVAGLYDLRPVPFQNAFPGVEIHANILHNILEQNFITKKSSLVSWMILAFLCLLVSSIAPFFRLRITIPIIFLIAAGFVYLTFYLFNHQNLWVENVRPV